MLPEAALRGAEHPFACVTVGVLSSLVLALGSHDEGTKEHAERTQTIATGTAIQMVMEPEEIRTVRLAAILHDIGKVSVPRSILNKPGRLTEEEWEIMRCHPEVGAELLASIPRFHRVRDAVRHHHERFDGRGYLRGLAGEDIPIEARVIGVVDAYDAMTNDRPHRRALSHEEAIEQLDEGAGSQFDPTVVEAVKAVVGESR